jgi:hypothetical protein
VHTDVVSKKTTTEPKQSLARKSVTWARAHKALCLVGVVIIVLVTIFLLRGWIRMTVVPAIVEAQHYGEISKVYDEEYAKLGDPFVGLGVKEIAEERSGCATDLASKFQIALSCQKNRSAGATIAARSLTKEQLIANAASIQSTLKAEGWNGFFDESDEGTSLVKLVGNVATGIDYTPDATYFKRIADVDCIFSSHTAFSVPDEPLFISYMLCARTFMPFGPSSGFIQP